MIWGHTGTGVLKACEQEKLLSMKVFFAMASPALFLWHFCCQFNRVFKSPDPESKIRSEPVRQIFAGRTQTHGCTLMIMIRWVKVWDSLLGFT